MLFGFATNAVLAQQAHLLLNISISHIIQL